MGKFLKLIVISFVYIFIFSTISYASFEDVRGHWAESEINNFFESEFIEGYDDGTFRPDKEITRAELCKIINAYMNYEVSGEWREENMLVAKEKGYLTTGTADDVITREEAFVVLSRVMNLDNIEFELQFIDSGEISVWALPAIKALSATESVKGYETNEIKPKNNMTRAEVVKVLHDFVGIGGVDQEIEDMEFSVGYLSHNKYGIEFIKIEEELEMTSGDVIILAATVLNSEDVDFEVVSGKEYVDFDEESLRLEAIDHGEVKISAKTLSDKKSILIKIK